MAVARKIAYNVVVSSVAKVLSTILALVSIGLITRYLGKDGFGNYATVLAFLSFFAAISDWGLYSVSTREISRAGADKERIMGNMFSLRLISSLIVFVLSPLVAWFFPYSREVKEGIVIVAASYIFSSAYQILNGIFQKNLSMDKVAFSELVGKIIQVVTIIIAIKMGLGFNWITSSLLFYMITSFALVYLWSRRYIKIKMRFEFSYWSVFLKESYPLGIAAVITFVYFKMDTILLSVLRSSADVGIYNAAYKVIENVSFFPSMIVGLVFPIIAQAIFSDKERFRDISDKTFKVFVLIVVPLVIGTLFLSDGIVKLIGGSLFADSAGVLRVLIFALAFIFFSSFFNAILIAGNHQKKLMSVLLIAAVFNVGANLIFIPIYSYYAAAIVSVLTEFFVAGAAFWIVVRELKYRPTLEKMGGIALAGTVMAIFMFSFQRLNFLLLALLGTLIYGFSLWIFKAVKTEEITSIISKKGVREYEPIS